MYKPRHNSSGLVRRLSPTALDLYLRDRDAFAAQGLKPISSRMTPATLVGISVHRTLQLAHETLAAPQRTPDALEALLREIWRQLPREQVFAKASTERWWGNRAVCAVRAYTELAEAQSEAMACEVPVSLFYPGGLEVSGQIDRVDRTDGGLIVIDYKTGQEPITEIELRRSPAAWCYAAGAQERYRQEVVELRWLYLTRHKSVIWRPGLGEIDRASAQLHWLAREAAGTAQRSPGRRAA
jgi:RecB family exonuclease